MADDRQGEIFVYHFEFLGSPNDKNIFVMLAIKTTLSTIDMPQYFNDKWQQPSTSIGPPATCFKLCDGGMFPLNPQNDHDTHLLQSLQTLCLVSHPSFVD